jgi:hypothetical protein
LNHEDRFLPNLPGEFDDLLLGYMEWTGGGDIEDEMWILLPPPEIWPWRYVVEYDEVNGHRYYRVPHPDEDDLSTDPMNWVELTSGLVDVNGNPAALAYEILAFMAQANAEPVGVQAMQNWFDAFQNVSALGLDPEDEESVLYTGSRANHSFQFHHDAAATWQFWQHIKQEVNFDAAY